MENWWGLICVERALSRRIVRPNLTLPDQVRKARRADNLPDPSNLLLHFQRFDKSQRVKFLSALVNDLELNEALMVSRRIEPRLRRDFLKELPLELALHVMSFVSCNLAPTLHTLGLSD